MPLNFNLFFLLIFLTACGVKGNPSPPNIPITASLMQNYPDIETDTPVDDVKKAIKPRARNK